MKKWTRGERLMAIIGVVGLTLVGSIMLAGPAQAMSPGNMLSPLGKGVDACIYQGYDTSPPGGTHNGTSEYGLDLVTGSCSSTATAGLNAYAPLDGTVSYWQASYGNLCVNTSDGRSYTLTHINASVTSGAVTAGDLLGTVAAAQPNPNLAPHNNNVSHIHFQIWNTTGCYNTSVIPFDTADNARICGAPNLTTSGTGTNGKWSGTTFTGDSCGAAAPSVSFDTSSSNSGVVMAQSSNFTMAFAQGPNNSLYAYWVTPGQAWNGPAVIAGAGTTFSAPVAVVTQSNSFTEVFAQGPNNSLYNYWVTPGQAWSGPGVIAGAGTTYSAPAAVVTQSNGFTVAFAQGPNNSLYNYWVTPGQAWSGPGVIAGAGTTFSAPATVVAQNSGFTQAFTQGPSNSLYAYWVNPGQAWGGPAVVAGAGTTFSMP